MSWKRQLQIQTMKWLKFLYGVIPYNFICLIFFYLNIFLNCTRTNDLRGTFHTTVRTHNVTAFVCLEKGTPVRCTDVVLIYWIPRTVDSHVFIHVVWDEAEHLLHGVQPGRPVLAALLWIRLMRMVEVQVSGVGDDHLGQTRQCEHENKIIY